MSVIIPGNSRCSICNGVIYGSDSIIGWQAFLNQEHHLWSYSDSSMHQACFDTWEHKEEFEHLSKFQPHIDFNDKMLQEMIATHGMPDWLKSVKEYRAKFNK